MLSGDRRPTYAHFWGNYGDTPWLALAGMLADPGRVAAGLASSGLLQVLTPHLLLPLRGWRWSLGTLPIVAIYGASANEQLRAFGIYYSIVLVPFLVVAAAVGARALARRFAPDLAKAELLAAAAVVLGALLVGSGSRGYSFRPWKAEVTAMPDALHRLADEPMVLVQSGLFPHAGYDERFRLLTPETLNDPRHAAAVVLFAPRVSAYPFTAPRLAENLAGLPAIGGLPDGLFAVRLPDLRSRCGTGGGGSRQRRAGGERRRCRWSILPSG
jgi:hypothetical protein